MKPKDRRERLFGNDKPVVRELDLFTNGYGRDMAILWGAYKTGSFDVVADLTQEEFAIAIKALIHNYNVGWMIEDRNAKFQKGWGPVSIVLGNYNGHEVIPEFTHFSWASTRNKLRAVVQFLQMMRYSKEYGIVTINGFEKDKKFLNRIERYGVLTFLATMPKGNPDGNRHIYYTHGRT